MRTGKRSKQRSHEPGNRRPDSSSVLPIAAAGSDFKALYRKLERTLIEIEQSENVAKTLERILGALIAGFTTELGLKAGRIYRREEDEYFLCCGIGASARSPIGLQVPTDYPPHLKTLEQGLLIMQAGDPGYDEVFERSIGVESTFAAITVGRDKRFVVAFSIEGEVREEQLTYSLAAVRHAINLKLEQEAFTGMLKEARAIQESLLPSEPPQLPGYEVVGRTRPAEVVSGDLYDYFDLPDGAFGVAIADASGHGVPAALLARDVITGLRTLATTGLTLSATVERLNQVIHRAALESKFVSLFYAQFLPEGRFRYCNAGHNPPLLWQSEVKSEFGNGGPILGPLPGAHYEEGTGLLAPGAALVLFTDGIVERESPEGEPFGVDRLRAAVLAGDNDRASELGDRIFAAVDRHAAGEAQRDDMTLVVVRRTQRSQ